MPRPVATPGFRQYAAALTGLPVGYLRPRPADRAFLRGLPDAGLPTPTATVTVRALRQVPKPNPTAFVAEGCRRPATIDMAMTTLLVEHPAARFLVDPAICKDVERRALAELPAILRLAVRPPAGIVSTAQALAEIGNPAIDFALPTHLHWDHVCGLLDLPGVPLWINAPEHDWAMTGPTAPVGGVRPALADRPTTTFTLDGPPVLTFTASHEVFGDSSVIAVDLAGHTPGSIGLLLHTDIGWTLLAGDAAWHHVQIDLLRQKTSYPGCLADVDRRQAFRTLHRLHAVKDRVTIVPTHDHAATAGLWPA